MITSRDNDKLKLIRKLHAKRERERTGLFVAEGEDLVDAAAANGFEAEFVLREGENVDDRYSLWVDEGLYYDMVDQTRWINHSCDPNAKLDVGVDEETGAVHARVLARRAIAAGEEIAYDYAFPAHLAEPCRCGSPRCRGLIIDEDALPLPGTAQAGGGAP